MVLAYKAAKFVRHNSVAASVFYESNKLRLTHQFNLLFGPRDISVRVAFKYLEDCLISHNSIPSINLSINLHITKQSIT